MKNIYYVAPTVVCGVKLTTITNAATFIDSIRERERTTDAAIFHPLKFQGKPDFNKTIISTLN